eukprot:jgi/Ulvmu1/1418/UM011_0147.1
MPAFKWIDPALRCPDTSTTDLCYEYTDVHEHRETRDDFMNGRCMVRLVATLGNQSSQQVYKVRPQPGLRACPAQPTSSAAVRTVKQSERVDMSLVMARQPADEMMSIAPMMDYTDLHFRQLARLLSQRTWLWTEMVVDNTIIHTEQLDKFLWFPQEQHPIVLQLGGSNPSSLRKAAEKAVAYGYDVINLNCGCPSDRVAGAGCFGASMMLQPALVADCCKAISEGAPGVPVSVKCRIGVDEVDDYGSLYTFISTVAGASPVTHFIIHARKCLLSGLSPHQNRTVPPLRYGWVYALKRDFPHLDFSLNGGIQSIEEVREILAHGEGGNQVHGVMIGRAAYNMPWNVLACADTQVFGCESDPAISRRQVIQDYCRYADAMIGRWSIKDDGYQTPSVRLLLKPLYNLFHGERGGRRWKAAMDETLRSNHSISTLSELVSCTLHHVDPGALDVGPCTVESTFKPFTAEQTGDWPPCDVPVVKADAPELVAA